MDTVTNISGLLAAQQKVLLKYLTSNFLGAGMLGLPLKLLKGKIHTLRARDVCFSLSLVKEDET